MGAPPPSIFAKPPLLTPPWALLIVWLTAHVHCAVPMPVPVHNIPSGQVAFLPAVSLQVLLCETFLCVLFQQIPVCPSSLLPCSLPTLCGCSVIASCFVSLTVQGGSGTGPVGIGGCLLGGLVGRGEGRPRGREHPGLVSHRYVSGSATAATQVSAGTVRSPRGAAEGQDWLCRSKKL